MNPIPVRAARQSFTGKGVTVAMIDSGWDRRVFDSRVLKGMGFVADGGDRTVSVSADDLDRHGHGTTCTSVLFDIAPDCRVVPLRIFNEELETSPMVLLAALNAAREAGAQLINLSLGTVRIDVRRHLLDACERAANDGIVTVAAVDGSGTASTWPASFQCVLSVGAARVTNDYEIVFPADFPVECGTKVFHRLVRGADGRYRFVNGASYSTAMVTGLLACWREGNLWLSIEDVRRELRGWTADTTRRRGDV